MFENISSSQSQPQPVPSAPQQSIQPQPMQPVAPAIPFAAQSAPQNSSFQPSLQQIPVQNAPGVDGTNGNPPTGDGKIYTMPEKFMPEKKSQKTPHTGTKKWVIIGGIIFAVVVIILAIVVYAFQISTKGTQTKTNQNQNANVAAQTNINATTNATNGTNATNTANTNTSSGTNATVNSGVGTVNKNLNDNINNQLFPNTNNANIANTNNTNTALPNRSNVVDASDQDKDNLTDEEEQKTYFTKINQPDSDRDGYIDGNEVLNGYSPAAVDEKLLADGLVIPYENKTFDWQMHYPAQWLAEAIDASNTEVFFTSDTMDGELVQVIVSDNTTSQTAAAWYAGLYGVEPSTLDAVTINGLAGVTTPDGFTYYFADAQHIFTINYNFGTKTEVHFRSTFEMMVKSFELTGGADAASATNTNSTTNANQNSNTQ